MVQEVQEVQKVQVVQVVQNPKTEDDMNNTRDPQPPTLGGYSFEVCANSVESCIAAQEGGADRVELCAGIPEGGTTPSYGEINQARHVLDEGARRGLKATRLHVIIRPRGGDFLYTELELQRMVDDIRTCRELGVDGVVFGCLRPDGTLDTEANARLLEAARQKPTPTPSRGEGSLISIGVVLFVLIIHFIRL